MPIARFQMPDGRVARYEVPDGTTPEQAQAMFERDLPNIAGPSKASLAAPETDTYKQIGMGALKGAANIGATLMRPIDYISDKFTGADAPSMGGLITGEKPRTSNEERRARIADFFKENASPESLAFKGGELGAEIAGTAGIGGLLAKGARAIGASPKIISALETGGFRLGGPAATTTGARVADAALRAGSGAVVGGASAGLVDPDQAGAGALIGGVAPTAVKAAGALGSKVLPKVGDEVRALAVRAKELGIDIPADRLVNSRPLNAAASSLEYVPLSGRTATNEKMLSQFNRAVSRTFGQDSDNVAFALKKADAALGDAFEQTLSKNAVKLDQTLTDDLVATLEKARAELNPAEAKIIENMSNSIYDKAKRVGDDLLVDGQAAYNIKKSLDRIANRTSNESFYARSLKNDLMGALERSLGPDKAAQFANVRKQYGNMLEVEKLVGRGAEAGVSPAKLANAKNLNNADLAELGDIAAQFLKTRESPHGAAQRIGALSLGGAALGTMGGVPLMAGGMAAGRAANTALNSNTLRSLLMNPAATGGRVEALGADPTLRALLYNAPSRLGGNSP